MGKHTGPRLYGRTASIGSAVTSPTMISVAIADRIRKLLDHESHMADEVIDVLTEHQAKKFGKDAILNVFADAEVYSVWKREGRQCLSMHPGLLKEVSLASSDKLYPEVFRAVPYMNPMFVFPDADTFDGLREGETARLAGMFCYTTVVAPIPYDTYQNMRSALRSRTMTTSDADADTLGVLTITEILDRAGVVIDMEVDRFTLSMSKSRTLKEAVSEILGRFRWEENIPGEIEGVDRRRKYLHRIVAQAMGALLYACSITLDSERVPTATVRRASNYTTGRRNPISLYRIGWTVGAALDRYRAQATPERGKDPSQQMGVDHQQDPQHRKAHFKRVWCGPGRSVPKMAFVSAYWTHREALGLSGVNTVRKIK